MKCFRTFILLGFAGLLLVTLVSNSRADEWDKATKITFNAPVELPGVVLQPGTYLFKLLDSPANRDIVQVFSEDRSKIYDTILAVPDYRLEPTGKTVVTFEERTAGSPEAVKAWFYPGDQYGLEFVYPKPRAVQLAQANNQHVPATPAPVATAPAQLKQAPVTAIQPTGEEVPLAQVHTPSSKPAPVQMATASEKNLPKTASTTPLIGLIGLIAIAGAFLLRFWSKVVA